MRLRKMDDSEAIEEEFGLRTTKAMKVTRTQLQKTIDFTIQNTQGINQHLQDFKASNFQGQQRILEQMQTLVTNRWMCL